MILEVDLTRNIDIKNDGLAGSVSELKTMGYPFSKYQSGIEFEVLPILSKGIPFVQTYQHQYCIGYHF